MYNCRGLLVAAASRPSKSGFYTNINSDTEPVGFTLENTANGIEKDTFYYMHCTFLKTKVSFLGTSQQISRKPDTEAQSSCLFSLLICKIRCCHREIACRGLRVKVWNETCRNKVTCT